MVVKDENFEVQFPTPIYNLGFFWKYVNFQNSFAQSSFLKVLEGSNLIGGYCYIPDPAGSRYVLFLLYSYLLYFTHSPEDPIGSDDPHSLLFFHYCLYDSMTHGSTIFRFPLVFTFLVILLLRLLSYYLQLLSLVHKYSHLLYCSIKGVQTVVVRLKSKINLAGLITPFAQSSPLQRL